MFPYSPARFTLTWLLSGSWNKGRAKLQEGWEFLEKEHCQLLFVDFLMMFWHLSNYSNGAGVLFAVKLNNRCQKCWSLEMVDWTNLTCLLGNLGNLGSRPTIACQLSSQRWTAEVVSHINCDELHQYYWSWHIKSPGRERCSQSFVRSRIAAWYFRNLKEVFWCTCHRPKAHSLQQILLPSVVNEERYEWSTVVNAEELAHHSLM